MPWFIRKYLVFGSVLGSPYFSEPEGFGYDLNMTLIFIGSLLFSLGICSAVYFIFRGGVVLKNELKLHSLPIFLFILFELALIFLWPAAIPRLFFPLLPLFCILFVSGLESITKDKRVIMVLANIVLLALYALLQIKLRLYFLLISKIGYLSVLILSFLASFVWLIPSFIRAKKYFILLCIASSIVATIIIIVDHRYIYATLYQAAQEAKKLEGPVAYFDEAGVSRWYLSGNGIYFPENYAEERQWDWLMENKVRYVLWTDEHNEGSALNIVNDSDFKDNFRRIFEFKQKMPDFFDLFLMEKGWLPERMYPVRHSEIYEVFP